MSVRGEPEGERPGTGRPEVAGIPGLCLGAGIEGLAWRSTRIPGISWLPLHVEEEERSGKRRGGGTVLIRMDPGCGYAPHRHVGTEDVLVLQGGYRDEFGLYRQGDHVHYPAGSSHSPVALGEGVVTRGPEHACVLLATVPLGIELLDG
jgi:anti-sigma factor ChrR (cupin superfamily)